MNQYNTPRPGDLVSVVDPRTRPWTWPSIRGHLPHLEKPGCTYFVTFCTAGSRFRGAPHTATPSFTELLAASEPHPERAVVRLEGRVAEIVQDALLHHHGERYLLHAWCVMPDHVHGVLTPRGDTSLSKVIHSWKSFSAKQINAAFGQTGRVWESGRFDHAVRSDDHLQRFVEYTEANPVAAGLCEADDRWPWSSGRFQSTRRWWQ